LFARLKTSDLSAKWKKQVAADLDEARRAFNGSSFKGCVMMVGGVVPSPI